MEHLIMPIPVRDVQKLYWCLPKLLTTSTTAFLGFEGVKLEVCVRSGSRSESLSLPWDNVRALRRVNAFLILSPVLGRIKVACRSYNTRSE